MAEDGSQSGGTKPQELSTDPDLRAIQLAEAAAKRDEAVATASKVAAEVNKVTAEAGKVAADADKVAGETGKAEIDAFSAAFPKGTAKPREGTLEIGEDVGLVGDLIAHSMMRRAGEEIRNDLRNQLSKQKTKILLVSSPDLIGSDWPYMAISEQLRQHRQELEQVKASLAPSPPEGTTSPSEGESQELRFAQAEMLKARGAFPFAGLAAASKVVQGTSSLVGGVAEIAALFRSDYEIAARKVSVGASPLLAAVAHFLVELVKEVNVEGFSLLKQSELFGQFTAAANLRLEVQRLAAELKESKVTPADRRIEWAKEARASYVEALTAEKPGYSELKPLRERMTVLQEQVFSEAYDVAPDRARVGVAEAVVQRFDSFATSLLKPPEKGYPPLIAAAIRERLHDEAKGYTHVLYAGVDTAGGESVARRTFLKSSIRFIGGAQVTYLLWNVKEERLVAADTRPFLAATKMRLGSGFTGGAETVPLG